MKRHDGKSRQMKQRGDSPLRGLEWPIVFVPTIAPRDHRRSGCFCNTAEYSFRQVTARYSMNPEIFCPRLVSSRGKYPPGENTFDIKIVARPSCPPGENYSGGARRFLSRIQLIEYPFPLLMAFRLTGAGPARRSIKIYNRGPKQQFIEP